MSERRRSLFVLLLVLGLIAASAYVVSSKKTTLGLDLQGGVQLVYEGKPTAQQPTVTQEALDRSLDIMRDRVDAFGVAEPELRLAGGNQIEVNLPGVANADRAAQQVGSTAQLFFYDWEANILDEACKPDPDENANEKTPITGFYQATKQAAKCPPQVDSNNNAADAPRFYAFNKISKKPFNNGQPSESRAAALEDLSPADRANAEVVKVPEGILVVRDQKANADAPDPDRWWVIQDNPALSGTEIKNPKQSQDPQSQQINVTFDFTDKGRKAFQDITREIAQRGSDNADPAALPANVSQHFAIVLDNELISAPYIDFDENPDGIDGVNGAQISGSFTIDEAQDLAKILEIGALPIRLELVSRSQVSATLGAQALDQGLIAGAAGFIIVALFLITFYRVLGVIAVVAMAIYALYFYALVKLVPIVLTLPGIAGLILTLGVAADANIVIFERVKEEVRAGRSVSQAISAGYKKGLTAILDANIVTFLVAFILFMLATAGVRGFALTLGVGVMLSLFTAVLATQAILYSLRRTRIVRSRAALGARDSKPIRFDFIGRSKWFFSMSGVILLICAIAMSVQGLNFGIDFEGGTRIVAPLERPATVDQVHDVLAAQGLGDAEVQTLSNDQLGQNVVQISAKELGDNGVKGVTDALRDDFGLADNPSTQQIGASFGQSVARSAIYAIIASLIIISIYIALRFQWKFAVPVMIALAHDLLITGGVYALLDREVTASTVAALLTILGFSLYDTIVVFDRVRENIPRMPNAAFSQIYNRSMSEVIVRSLATSFCAALPILALLLFGGDTLKDFAFALLIGTLSGTYSSVFIAGPVLTHWKEREPVYKARERRIRSQFGGELPAYAVAMAGAPVDVAPKEKRRRERLTQPADPTQGVSREEFDDMVRDLGIEEEQRQPAAARSGRPAGGRRARSRSDGGQTPPKPPAAGGDGAGGEDKPKKPRNRRHGRPR
ncbi:MAG TPA: protein translocase subunit SecD [Solirubrobacteraceae bacterium]|nr:protein translocase subunit SecD [Solirubrobacteraceae bacterium]